MSVFRDVLRFAHEYPLNDERREIEVGKVAFVPVHVGERVNNVDRIARHFFTVIIPSSRFEVMYITRISLIEHVSRVKF